MTDVQYAVLSDIAERGQVDLRRVSEPYRQRVIDLAMKEPCLVDIDGPWLFLTAAGRRKAKGE